jgi:hypothetical protein
MMYRERYLYETYMSCGLNRREASRAARFDTLITCSRAGSPEELAAYLRWADIEAAQLKMQQFSALYADWLATGNY